MSELMRTLENICTYMDDLLLIRMGTYDDRQDKVDAALDCLRLEKLRVNRNPTIRSVGQNPKKKTKKTVDLTSAYLAF